MGEPEVPLTEDEVRRIGRIIETLEQSTFDYLQLELGALKLTVAKGNAAMALPTAAPAVAAPAPAPTPAAPPPAPSVASPAPAGTASAPAAAAASAAGSGLVDIVSPMIGRFYSQPEPGAAPFVTPGSKVGPETTVGLVEAMKMFNAVHAGTTGTIAEVCVQDATIVEYGQVLFRVRPS
ncbi:MAG: acetyl-CoA carboxylase biotin carboxyl carrier protein [Rhodocyclaceae bacterium]|nr:acetyl-CoA carboxylase biotin carboxyl carrier protein [Rhodocyclaceae bacterium]MCE2979462.1 acetyl-CoA carboxylase biotin carboxyl carrier protein [Betaproteobacteria bacterium]MCA3076222.1 acetyl-CoA carboxylase biotin carboxyl carrier protein [Rhodocyclaceae bacterium]MCA3100082.1 acetyl-CoA carboxylase biotin carboxyl carrier protein [Rhodocyclaceae bacterium]MCA3100982.1 acetyl-CoA carboxylase biotin carboxyl carrier protein [Rhodocyclaceae bacterium]